MVSVSASCSRSHYVNCPGHPLASPLEGGGGGGGMGGLWGGGGAGGGGGGVRGGGGGGEAGGGGGEGGGITPLTTCSIHALIDYMLLL